jgi:uncharacterized protein (DUF433 family)
MGMLPIRQPAGSFANASGQHNYNISRSLFFFMKTSPRIIPGSSVLAGKPVIRGTRISVDLVLGLLASGWEESVILKEYPGLEHEDILACIRYAQEIVRKAGSCHTPSGKDHRMKLRAGSQGIYCSL